MDSLATKTLDELCETITVGHVGSMASEYVPEGIPFLRSQNVHRGRLDLSDVKFVPPDFHNRLKKSRLQANDIVIVRTGEPGAAALIPADLGEANCSDVVIARPNSTTDARYLCYAINATARQYIAAHVVGAVQQHFNVGSARNLRVATPSLRGQRAIADVLGALDDKIAANERASLTALELGSASYEAASRSSDWMDVPLERAARWYSGGTPNTAEPRFWNGDIPWISAASLKSPWLDHSDRRVTNLGAASGTRLAPKGSVIFVVRGMSLKTEFRIGITQRDVAFGQDCKALVPLDGIAGDLLFHAIRNRTVDVLDLVDEAGHGTGRLATDRIEQMVVQVPSDPSDRINETLRSMNDLAASRQRESRALAELRDLLLPRLMSGEIRVRDAEKVVEEAL